MRSQDRLAAFTSEQNAIHSHAELERLREENKRLREVVAGLLLIAQSPDDHEWRAENSKWIAETVSAAESVVST